MLVNHHLAEWDARMARATSLAARDAGAEELLRFYRALAGWQRAVAEQWLPTISAHPLPGLVLEALDATLVLDAVPSMLAWLGYTAPPDLRRATAALAVLTPIEWRSLFEQYVATRGEMDASADPFSTFVLEAVIQPLADIVGTRAAEAQPVASGTPNRCPRCDGLPVAGVLREEGQGARRSLVCGVCLHEWGFVRLACVACGEQRFDVLPVFTAEELPLVRIEACDTCRGYLKTIDGTKDGHVVAVVDDLATVALDIWARGEGYTRRRPSLLRT
jgi:formate dehydrogenase maturation protein FdhE